MASHGRRKSRGSMSILSFETIRSMSRTGSRQVPSSKPEDFGRSPSSLSYCDPNNQPPATTSPVAAGISSSGSPHTSTDALTNANSTDQESVRMSKRKAGSMSWFTFGKPKPASLHSFSDRFRLPRGQSSSSVAKSTISAPVLTSTINTKVARSQGVHCGELTQETFDKSTWNGKLGWVRTENEHRTAAIQARALAERIEAKEKFQLKPSARLQKMGEAVRDHFRRDKTREHSRMAFRAVPYSTCSVDSLAEPSSKQKLARSKGETINLCKDKIRTLTGNAEPVQRSYSTGLLTTTPKPGAEQWDPPLLHHGDQKSTISSATFSEPSESFSHHFHTNDGSSQVGSLTRSFNSALDRGLDTETSNMDFIRNKAAKLGIRSKGEKALDKFKATISAPLPIDSQLTTDHMDENNPVVPKWQAIPPPTETTDAAKMLAAMPEPTKAPAANEQDAPEWARLPIPEGYVSNANSPTKDKVAAPVVRRARLAGQNDQDDEINPVGMHGDVAAFARVTASVRLPDPKLSYPEQLQLTGEYPQQKRQSRLDMMQFLAETEEAVRKKEEQKKEKARAEEAEKKAKKSLRKSISRVFKKE